MPLVSQSRGTGSIRRREITAEEVIKETEKDYSFYKTSGGGVTLSGGEPTLQAEFALAILSGLRKKNISTAIETSGSCDEQTLERFTRVTDLFLFDFKHSNAETLRKMTGLMLSDVTRALALLDRLGKTTILRCPIVPTVNDTPEHAAAIAEIAEQYACIREIGLLPYHDFGCGKAEKLGLPSRKYAVPSAETMQNFRAQIIRNTNKIVRNG